ncbi:MAG: 2-C-methyl-D-erythritol 4-phosphate cytidylyltransferase, partial [Vicinamibacteria bacterium]
MGRGDTVTTVAIVAAGGSGTRLNASQPKQFLELAGKPLLAHT